ncbi:hypothetical protein K503DRAFT_51166 [Rhizopogon vinicolor AM-OR11-026]|uniref:EamA domain-containing protein n=1 Tax=Rhizopogon vinicolor AM-OR11-026 TaxID=1314800 RepID=A0A1B7N4P4_9AGAM|nr:hypothetical protein K503DRAFT_51166 [Rhizopogon vinicolor AM-OR11-026]
MTSRESPLVRDVEHNYANDSNQPSLPGFIASNAGILYIISAQFFFACMNISVKVINHLDPPVHPLEIIVVRMGITLIGCVIYMIVKRIPDPITGPKGVRTLLIFRGITGCVLIY